MSTLITGLICFVCITAGLSFGFFLQGRLPKHHFASEAKDGIKLGTGLLSTLTAMVLGLLITSAKGSLDTTNAEIVKIGAQIIMLDHILAAYGPETKAVRNQLRESVSASLDRILPKGGSTLRGARALESGTAMQEVQNRMRELKPIDNQQQSLLAQATEVSNDIARQRWSLIEQMQERLPTPLLALLILWSAILFIAFGLLSIRNWTVVTTLLIAAISVSSAICLVLELNRPLDGFIKASDAPLRKAIELINQ